MAVDFTFAALTHLKVWLPISLAWLQETNLGNSFSRSLHAAGICFFTPSSYIKKKKKRNKQYSVPQIKAQNNEGFHNHQLNYGSLFFNSWRISNSYQGCRRQVIPLFLEISMFYFSPSHLVIFWGHCFHMVILGKFNQTVQSFHLPGRLGFSPELAWLLQMKCVCLSL